MTDAVKRQGNASRREFLKNVASGIGGLALARNVGNAAAARRTLRVHAWTAFSPTGGFWRII